MHIVASTLYHTNWYCGGALMNKIFRLHIFFKIPDIGIGKRQQYRTYSSTYFTT